MRKIMYNRALFILRKIFNPSHFYDIIENEVFDSHSMVNHFVVKKMLLDHCSFYTKTENFGF